jgi:hypothetical protein
MIMMMKRIMVYHFTIIFDTNEIFYHSKIFKIYIILNNYYVYIDTMIVKYNFKIC